MKMRFVLLWALLSVCVLGAQDTPARHSDSKITYLDAVVLGLVEGVTEYLPVSSTGHLILTNELLGLNADSELEGDDGLPVIYKDHGVERPMTIKDGADAYAIIIQFGAILAVVILYWKRLWTILMGVFGKNRGGFRLLVNLLVAFMPAAVLGLLFRKFIEQYLFSPVTVAVALIFGAGLMFFVEKWRKKNLPPPETDFGPDLPDLSIRSSLLIGLLQCVAMWPGMSRSMMTLVGGYLSGLNPRRAAEFSFLLGLITLSAASLYKTAKNGPDIVKALDVGPLLVGILIATVSAAIAVKWLVGYLTRHGLNIFAWYRLILAAIVLAAYWAGWINI